LKRQYAARIDIKIGLEAEYYPARLDQLKALCARHDLDYLVLGNHFHTLEGYGRYYGGYADTQHLFEHYIEDTRGALASGLYSLYAHPDLFVRSLKSWTKDAEACAITILQLAKDYGIPVEYNLGGSSFRRRRDDLSLRTVLEVSGPNR
jgi:histidinol-phosphatase (PHP family)